MSISSEASRLSKAASIEARCRGWLEAVASHPLLGALVLAGIVLATDLSGLIRLPPVDRTEVVYAETSREMLNAGRLTGPSYLGEHERHRPILTFWLQMAAAKVLGDGAADRISTYRIPSLLGVLCAVLATYWLAGGVAGRRVAWGAAALVAVTPIAALQAQLAITESVAFAPAIVAELALLRLYVCEEAARCRRSAMLMWAALGIGIALNALAVPILLIATVIALYAMDRDLAWLRRLHFAVGVPLMLALGSPWIIALVAAEGSRPFAGLDVNEILNMLGGSQAMKLRAWPGSFTLGFVVGFLPGVLLLLPALRGLWRGRRDRLQRFVLAWIAGYLAYLEFVSSKPALYTVQVLLPAAAVAVLLLLAGRDDDGLRFSRAVPAWPGLLLAALYPCLVIVLHKVTHEPLTAAMVAGAAGVAGLLSVPAIAAQAMMATTWLLTTLVGFSAFLSFTFGVLLPAQKNAWTTEVLAEALAPLRACGEVAIIGYREPSAVFTYGAQNVFLSGGDYFAAQSGRAHAGERSPAARFIVAEDASKAVVENAYHAPTWCLATFNVTRGCVQRFTIFDTGASSIGRSKCQMDPRYRCDAPEAAFSAAKRCKQ